VLGNGSADLHSVTSIVRATIIEQTHPEEARLATATEEDLEPPRAQYIEAQRVMVTMGRSLVGPNNPVEQMKLILI
jgi:hypothetical protein